MYKVTAAEHFCRVCGVSKRKLFFYRRRAHRLTAETYTPDGDEPYASRAEQRSEQLCVANCAFTEPEIVSAYYAAQRKREEHFVYESFRLHRTQRRKIRAYDFFCTYRRRAKDHIVYFRRIQASKTGCSFASMVCESKHRSARVVSKQGDKAAMSYVYAVKIPDRDITLPGRFNKAQCVIPSASARL